MPHRMKKEGYTVKADGKVFPYAMSRSYAYQMKKLLEKTFDVPEGEIRVVYKRWTGKGKPHVG